MSLPVATTARWQPLRLGLVDLFYYDQQEFHFRDGRLLLRGNNGTGKSKVLALTLPFLLDGDLTPSRVEPDGDRNKRMEWNLLLGGVYEERTGYTWLELGRVAEDGERCYVTIGCGLKAVAGRGIADRWFFLTSRRVGEDLTLVGPTGTVLTRDRLTEALGEHGQVTQKAEQHRRTVDEHLFQLGAERYDALVSLLIQLRAPQLSKQPKEELLSRALSEALAPLDQALVTDIAAAFHDLEQQREELAGLRDTREHVNRFLTRYRRYAQTAARRYGRELRSAYSTYEDTGRQLAGVGETIAQARRDEAAVAAEQIQVRAERAEQTATRDELATSPELARVEDARRLVEHATRTASAARSRHAATQIRRDQQRDHHERAAVAAEASRALAAARLQAAAGAAEAAGVVVEHQAAVGPLALPDGPPDGLAEPAVAAAERQVQDAARRRREAAGHVLELAELAERRHTALTAARQALTERESERDEAADAAEAGRAAAERVAGAYVEQWRRYAAEVTELALPLPDELGLAAWAGSLAGENPAGAALATAQAGAHRELARAHAAAEQELAGSEAALAELVAERERLESGQTAAPPVPYTRDQAVRDGLPGAPLWRVTDFAPELPEQRRAGLEAALESAGLLDAWLTPDGRLLDPDRPDVVLIAGTAVTGPDLGGALRPAVEPDVEIAPETVAAVLTSVGLDTGDGVERDAPVWVGTTGRWRLGPLRGAWMKPAAEFVGAGAREQARRRRLAALAGEITAAETALAQARQRLAAVADRQRTLATEVAAAPSDEELRDAHRAAAAAAQTLAAAEVRLAAQRAAVEEAVAAAGEADRVRDEAAAQLRTPTGSGQLRAVQAAAVEYGAAAVALVDAARQHLDRLGQLATWAGQLAAAETGLAEADRDRAEAEEQARVAGSRLSTLEDSLGATVAEINARVAETEARIAELGAAADRLEHRLRECLGRRAHAEGQQDQLRTAFTDQAQRRDTAVRAFQGFAATGLLAVAVPDLETPDLDGAWAADPAVRLARRLESQVSDVDDSDEAWRRAQDDIAIRQRELSESLSRHGHHAMAGLDGGLFVVSVQFQGRTRAPDQLATLLADEVDYRERMLTAREREVIEEHLVNDVAASLQSLIADAEEQLAAMNRELSERPTSTGMRLRLRWLPRPDGPAGLAEARTRLLRQSAELWSPEDRAAVGDFLQRQIEAERARDEYGTWGDHLRRALDYRAWHRFVIERYQDSRWRPATGPASGGERVLAASLPLFAAASAHYRSAHRHAPRLVLLDEAFAGVDDDSRAKCLGLLAHFDLDVVMTSEREWGFYATVPGIATHQLVRRDGIDAVHVTTWQWDGTTPREVTPAVAAAEDATGSLW